MSALTLVTPAPSFGIHLQIYNGSAYVNVGGLYDLKPPAPKAEAPQDTTSHDASTLTNPTGMPTGAGIKTYTPSMVFDYTEVTGEYYEDTASSRDAGQVALEQALNKITKFKVIHDNAATDVPIIFNAIPLECERLTQPVNGKLARRFTLKPTGVPPAS